MKNKKIISVILAALTALTISGCASQESEHTTYSSDQVENMSDDELESAMLKAAEEIEAADKQTKTEKTDGEPEKIDFWKDVKVTFEGVETWRLDWKAEYVGDNETLKKHCKFKNLHFPIFENDEDILNGSTVSVACSIDKNFLNGANIEILGDYDSEQELYYKEYTVEGLKTYLTKLGDYDYTEIDNAAREYIETMESFSLILGNGFAYDGKKYTVDSVEYHLSDRVLAFDDGSDHNKFLYFIQASPKCGDEQLDFYVGYIYIYK